MKITIKARVGDSEDITISERVGERSKKRFWMVTYPKAFPPEFYLKSVHLSERSALREIEKYKELIQKKEVK